MDQKRTRRRSTRVACTSLDLEAGQITPELFVNGWADKIDYDGKDFTPEMRDKLIASFEKDPESYAGLLQQFGMPARSMRRRKSSTDKKFEKLLVAFINKEQRNTEVAEDALAVQKKSAQFYRKTTYVSLTCNCLSTTIAAVAIIFNILQAYDKV